MTELSYVSGISDVPLLGRTIGQALDRAADALGRPRGAGLAFPGHPLDVGRAPRPGPTPSPPASSPSASSAATASASGP